MNPKLTALPVPIHLGVEISRRYFPAAATRMSEVLPVLLRSLLIDVNDPVRWKLSLLTDGGYPFEFTFSTLNDGIRYTIEIAPPKQAPHSRLTHAHTLLQEFDNASFDEEGFAFLKEVQNGGTLRYGAWIGVRHRENDTTFKVYAEVPPEGEATAMNFLNSRLCRPVGINGRLINLQMIGWYPVTGELEFYFRICEMRPWEIVGLMHPIGLESNNKILFELLQAVYGRPIYQKMPGSLCGFSYTLPLTETTDASTRTFSFFAFAETLFGDDAGAHRKLLRYFDRLGIDMSYYANLSAPTIRHRGRWTHHGMFGLTVGQDIAPISHIGLRPPNEDLTIG